MSASVTAFGATEASASVGLHDLGPHQRFELTHPKITALESAASDHSANCASVLSREKSLSATELTHHKLWHACAATLVKRRNHSTIKYYAE